MTYEEFLKALELHGKDKFQFVNGAIRHMEDNPAREYCPITFLYRELTGQIRHISSAIAVAKQLGLSYPVICSIIDAADMRSNISTRNDLIKALNLK